MLLDGRVDVGYLDVIQLLLVGSPVAAQQADAPLLVDSVSPAPVSYGVQPVYPYSGAYDGMMRVYFPQDVGNERLVVVPAVLIIPPCFEARILVLSVPMAAPI